jgi:hypothetical protein
MGNDRLLTPEEIVNAIELAPSGESVSRIVSVAQDIKTRQAVAKEIFDEIETYANRVMQLRDNDIEKPLNDASIRMDMIRITITPSNWQSLKSHYQEAKK